MFKKILIIPIAFTLIHCGSNSVQTPEDLPGVNQGEKIVQINNTIIKEGYLDLIGRVNPRLKAQLENPIARGQFVDNLITQELLYQQAIKEGLENSQSVKEKQALYNKIIIAEAYLDDYLAKKAKKMYEENKDSEFTKVEISHIQIGFDDPEDKKEKFNRTKEEAKKLIDQIKAELTQGKNFAELAKEKSDDKATQRKGGSLGKVSKDDNRLARKGLKVLAEEAFKLKNGEISQPIETKKGFHIIKIDSEVSTTPFEEAERTIRFQIQKTARDEIETELKANAKIIRNEKQAPVNPNPGDDHHGHDHGHDHGHGDNHDH